MKIEKTPIEIIDESIKATVEEMKRVGVTEEEILSDFEEWRIERRKQKKNPD